MKEVIIQYLCLGSHWDLPPFRTKSGGNRVDMASGSFFQLSLLLYAILANGLANQHLAPTDSRKQRGQLEPRPRKSFQAPTYYLSICTKRLHNL